MQQNILRSSGVTNIFISYKKDGTVCKYPVKLRFQDDVSSFFVTDLVDDFNTPQQNQDAELIVYTTDGQYKNNTKVFNTTFSSNEVTFEVAQPKIWEFNQMRKSSRFVVNLPLEINYEDGYSIKTISYDISTGGISFHMKNDLPKKYKQNSAILKLQIPADIVIPIETRELSFNAKFIREIETFNLSASQNLCVFKFIEPPTELQSILRAVLMHLYS